MGLDIHTHPSLVLVLCCLPTSGTAEQDQGNLEVCACFRPISCFDCAILGC